MAGRHQLCEEINYKSSRGMMMGSATASSSSSSAAAAAGLICYSSSTSSDHHHHHLVQLEPPTNNNNYHHQIQQSTSSSSFVSDPEMFNLTAGMEMIGFHKNHHHHHNNNNALLWKSTIISKPGQGQQHLLLPHQQQPSPSSSKTINHHSTTITNFYHHHENEYNNNDKPSSQGDFTPSGISETTSSGGNLIHHHDSVVVSSADHHQWQHQQQEENHHHHKSLMLDSSSSLRPIQEGLSLSLSNSISNINNPSSSSSTIAFHSFDLITQQHGHHNQMMMLLQQQQQQQQDDGYLNSTTTANKAAATLYNHHGGEHHFVLKNSKYLLPAQHLLNEFCTSLDSSSSSATTNRADDHFSSKHQKMMHWEQEEENPDSSSNSSKKHSLTSIEFSELQKRKTKLLSMLEEVDRRYRHYRNQMKAVVSSFEAVAGNGAATVYSAMALKAMSRHFRCLKDGILGQIHMTRKTLGEKDPVAPGTTRGETPRLKIIDQTLRQQRAFQQMSMMETHPWRPQRGLPERSVSVLRAWLFEHFLHPYPSDVDKHILARQTGLSRSQVSNWFINARVRLWKPMVEEMYLEETKENENNIIIGSSDQWSTDPADNNVVQNQNQGDHDDEKPTPDRLVRFDSPVCASSSIIINKNDPIKTKSTVLHHMNNPQLVTTTMDNSSFGSVELDFSSYTHQQHTGGGGGVSLTLGLQQHAGGTTGVGLAFQQPQNQLLYSSRDQIEDCDQSSSVQYSPLLDGSDQGQNQLPYRNLMGAQLLHDLAG